MRDREQKFMDRMSPEPNTGCWLWLGALSNGYGYFCGKGAHRWAYENLVGVVPAGAPESDRANVKSKLPKIITDRNAPECEICGAIPATRYAKGWGWSGRSRKFVRDLKSTKTVFALWCPRCNDSMHCLRINPTEGEVLELFKAAKKAAENSPRKHETR